jgi:pimeloyl-ACP methyl ester carboxylesterase
VNNKASVACVCALVFSGLLAGGLAAQKSEIPGHWEGAIHQPAGDLRFAVDFSTQGTAAKGTFTMSAIGAYQWPLSVTDEITRVKFRLPTGLLFEGEFQGGSITGKVPSPIGGHTDPFLLQRRPASTVPYKEEKDVSFSSNGVVLKGTVRLPLAPGKHTAIFLMQGSGPVDREGEAFYADHFARQGIVTLVYDKRGTGTSGGDYRQESFDDFAADALAGIHYLQARPEVNPKRVGLYGRSHGGIVAPLAAASSTDVAFIVNVSGAGVSPHRQVTYQAEAQMRRDGFGESDIAEALAYLKLKWDVARTGGERWSELQAATENARDKKWLSRVQPATKLDDIVPSWKLQMGYDPMPALERVKCPVLAIFGEFDSLTPVAETIANYRVGLAKASNQNATIHVFPKADYALLVWPGTTDQAHWPTLATGYVDMITDWIKNMAARPR